MKFFLASTLCLFIAVACHAQDNPYAVFGYKPKVQYKTNQIDVYKVKNNDSTSNIKYLIFDRENKAIRLLDDRDSVIKSITYTDKDLLRWMTSDPYAKKYPSMSPYNYGGNNPIRNIDMNGDSIRTTGSASATGTYKQTMGSMIGNNGTFAQDSKGNWTVSQTDEQALNMTPGQADVYKDLSNMISNPNTASFSLIDGNDALSHSVAIGDNGTAGTQSATPRVHTIDMGDIKAMGSGGMLTAAGALGHELKEGFDIQTQHLTTQQQIRDAHSGGIRFENAINGTAPNGRYEDWQPSPAGTIRIPIVRTINGVVTPQIITITLHNDNFGPADITNNVR